MAGDQVPQWYGKTRNLCVLKNYRSGLESMAEHDIILQAISYGDADRAIETMKKHITIVGVRFNDLVSNFNTIIGDK